MTLSKVDESRSILPSTGLLWCESTKLRGFSIIQVISRTWVLASAACLPLPAERAVSSSCTSRCWSTLVTQAHNCSLTDCQICSTGNKQNKNKQTTTKKQKKDLPQSKSIVSLTNHLLHYNAKHTHHTKKTTQENRWKTIQILHWKRYKDRMACKPGFS